MHSSLPNHIVSHPENSPRLLNGQRTQLSASPSGEGEAADALHPSWNITRLIIAAQLADIFFFKFLHSSFPSCFFRKQFLGDSDIIH